MPIRRDFKIELALDEVLRAQGVRDRTHLRYPMQTTIDDLLAGIDGLLEPAVAHETWTVAELTDSHLSVEASDAVLHGSVFNRVMAEAVEITAVVCTIGPRVEKQSAEYFSQGEGLRGLLLDGIGSAAVGALGSRACHAISEETGARGYHTGSPVSPGSPRFSVAEQRELFKLVPAGEIGVSLSGSGLMVPRKSISMVIGVGDRMRRWTHAESCDHCNLGQTCPYRARA